MEKRLFYLVICLLFISFFALSNDVYADTGLTIKPIKVSHTLNPGESVSGIISLKNESSNVILVEVMTEDFEPSAGSDNKINFVGRAGGNSTALDWIDLTIPDDFEFEEGGSRSIPYTITAPSDAEPGGHFAVAFFKATELGDTGTLKVGTRLGMLIFITVPGNRLQKGELLDFSGPVFVQKSPVQFSIEFKNTGTVHFEPKGTITIRNIFGKRVGEVPVSGQSVLPTAVKEWKVTWQTTGVLFGRYTADIEIVDGEGNVLTGRSVSFYAFPLGYLVSFFGAIIAIFLLLKFLRKRINISISVKK